MRLLHDNFITGVKHCPGRKIRQYYQIKKVRESNTRPLAGASSTKCRSRRRLTNLVCSGLCASRKRSRKVTFGQSDGLPSACCKPLRIQSKRVRMVCDDGTSLTQIVQKVRRCGCQTCTWEKWKYVYFILLLHLMSRPLYDENTVLGGGHHKHVHPAVLDLLSGNAFYHTIVARLHQKFKFFKEWLCDFNFEILTALVWETIVLLINIIMWVR